MKIRVRVIETNEIQEWDLESILNEINRDRSDEWTDYDETDWLDGWNEWIEGEFYSLKDINGKPLLELTKFSETNLNVILNFLLYAGLEEEYTQTAYDYVAEDHVDGEESPQAVREIALSSELIREGVELTNSLGDEFDIYYNDKNKLIYAISEDDANPIYVYRLVKPQEVIEVEHRDEILDYCLAVKTEDDEVSLGDIFVHGKYVELIREV